MALMIFQNDKSRKARRAENGDDVRGAREEKRTGYCLGHNTSDICTGRSVGPPPDLDKQDDHRRLCGEGDISQSGGEEEKPLLDDYVSGSFFIKTVKREEKSLQCVTATNAPVNK